MTVPPWLWWLTYLGLPLAAALLVAVRRAGWSDLAIERSWGSRARRSVVFGLAASALIIAFDFLRMVGDLNWLGLLVFLGLLASQVGLAVGLARTTPARAEPLFAALAVATTVTMLLVRAQVIWIFG